MTATPGTIPALPQYQPGALPLSGDEALEIVNTTNATTASSWYILLTDLVGKAPSVMSTINPTSNDRMAIYRPSDGLYYSIALGDVPSVQGNLPTGGNTGQFLQKSAATNFASAWVNIASAIAATTGITITGSTSLVIGLDNATTSLDMRLRSLAIGTAINSTLPLRVEGTAILENGTLFLGPSPDVGNKALIRLSHTAATAALLIQGAAGNNWVEFNNAGLVIGGSYAASQTAPVNGLMVEGNVWLGTTTGSGSFYVTGTSRLIGPVGVGTTTIPATVQWLSNGTSLVAGPLVVGTTTIPTGINIYGIGTAALIGPVGIGTTVISTALILSVLGTAAFSGSVAIGTTIIPATVGFLTNGTTLVAGPLVVGTTTIPAAVTFRAIGTSSIARLGVGTTTPGAALDISGAAGDTVRIGGAQNPQLTFLTSSSNTAMRNWGFISNQNAAGDFNLMRSSDHTSLPNVMVMGIDGTSGIQFTGGIIVGSPTGGNKGAGTINVAADIYKNNTTYTNPDYVFEHFYNGGVISRFKDNPGASKYRGLMPLEELRTYTKENHRLPAIDEDSAGIFARSDITLELIEEAFLHIMQSSDRITALERKLSTNG